MPKELVPCVWVKEACLFRQQPVDMCSLCERPFTLFNNHRHCSYCGRVFHRRDCSASGLGRHRACTHCDDYRSMLRDKLSNGEVFECVSECLDVQLSLCEATGELVLHWISLGIKETVDLLSVVLRKGFTSQPRYGVYEPLKSVSLVIRDTGDVYKVLHLKAANAWTCQLWADGLKTAQYVYRCMLHQERTRLYYLENGVKVQASWFTTHYLIDSLAPPTTQLTPSLHAHTQLTTLKGRSPPTRVFASLDSGYCSDARPWEVKGHRGSLPIWLSASSLDSPPHAHSWHTLPYRYSHLSELCRCHDYEVLPSRSIDVGSKVTLPSLERRCCRQCVNTCRLVEDLDNL